MYLRRLLTVWLAIMLVICPTAPAVFAQNNVGAQDKVEKAPPPPKFALTLSPGKAPTEKIDSAPVALAQPLPAERVMELLKRLSTLKQDAVKVFKLPEQSLVRPKLPGIQTMEPFPPKSSSIQKPKSPVNTAPLRVLRVSPTGAVDTVSQLAVTFSQPMVPIAEAKIVDPKNVLTLTPEPEGAWQWAGTQTILFTPKNKRLPKSTNYALTVPTTSKSTSGAHLEKQQSWNIATPTLKLTAFYPHQDQSQPASPVMLAFFNQSIDRQTIIKHVQVLVGKTSYSIRPVDDGVISKNKDYKNLVKDVPSNQWLAFQTTKPLPLGGNVQIAFGAGCPSAEGPLKTAKAQSFTVAIHGALTLKQSPEPGISPDQSYPRIFTFSNLIDLSKFQPSMVKITPACPVPAQAANEWVAINGRLKPFTKYTVEINGNLTDIFGQKLGRTVTRSFVTGARSVELRNDDDFVTIPVGQKPVYSLWAQGTPRVKVRIFKTKPEDWATFNEYQQKQWEGPQKKSIGTLVATKICKVGVEDAVLDVDLSPYLTDGFGQFAILCQTEGTARDQQQLTGAWVQVTAMAVDAFKGKTLNALATTLKDGTAIKDAQFTLLPENTKAVTDSSGLAKLPLPGEQASSKVLVAKKGKDIAILPDTSISWSMSVPQTTVQWYTVSDRHLYKPGEKVKIKGWARGMRLTDADAIDLFSCNLHIVSYSLTGSDGTELKKGKAAVDASGGFSFDLDLPEKMNLGQASVYIEASPDWLSTLRQKINPTTPPDPSNLNSACGTAIGINVQEFRRPEFEMKVASSLGNTMLAGDSTILTATARYFGGGTLSDSAIDWKIAAQQTDYSPAGWPEFSFGRGSPCWNIYGLMPPARPEEKTIKGRTDAAGVDATNLRLDSFTEGLPVSCTCEATVQDVNRQAWSDSVTILVHSAKNYVGLKLGKSFYHRGEPIDFKVIATDIDGHVVSGKTVELRVQNTISTAPDIEPDDNSASEQDKGKSKNQEKEKEKVIARQTITSTVLPQTVNFDVAEGGQYQIVATIVDAEGRKNETTVSAWVEGNQPPAARTAELQKLLLIPDHTEYQPGDVAEIMVNTPFYPATGLIIIRRNTITSTIPLVLQSSSQTLKIPITKDYFPNLNIAVYLTGTNSAFASGNVDLKVPPRARKLALSAVAADPEVAPGADTVINIDLKDSNGQPVASGQVALVVADEAVLALDAYKWADPLDIFYPAAPCTDESTYMRPSVLLPKDKRKLDAAHIPPAALPPPPLPGSPDAGASPAGSRGITGSRGYFQRFAYGQSNEVAELSMRPRAKGMAPPSALPPPALPGSAVGGMPNQAPISLRSEFSALALFAPALMTDQNGKAQVKLHLPDSLTRYRIMAVAVSGTEYYGACDGNVTARLPLTVKPSAPRFLNFGDKCELPMVLQNQTDKALRVEVVTRAQNARFTHTTAEQGPGEQPSGDPAGGDQQQSAGQVVDVPARDRVEVRFPMATVDDGKAQFQCAAVSGDLSDAAEFSLPVYMPATTESFATYGQIDNDAIVQKLDRPHDIFKQFGGLTVTTSSTAMQALTDAYFYLKHYTFECSEQISSRMIAMLSLQNVLSSFGKLKDSDATEFAATVQKDIDTVSSRQNSDGSFGFWMSETKDRWPYMSLQVAMALHLAKQKGYKVDAGKLSLCHKYLTDIVQHIPTDYDKRSKLSLEARAINIRYLQNDSDPAAAKRLIRRALKAQLAGIDRSSKQKADALEGVTVDLIKDDLPLECAAWLLPVLSNDKGSVAERQLLRRFIDSQIKETASTASANEVGYGWCDYCMFYSPRRTDAVVLEALMADQPDSELVAKFARGLLAHRKNGAWQGTQENGYVLQALDKYFATYEKQTPDFEEQAWLGDTLVGLQRFAGRTTESKNVFVPTDYLLSHGGDEILINKAGPGRLYYRIGLDYAPRNLDLKPADFGFTVERHYEPVDKKSDVRRDTDGTWHIKAGAIVRAKLHFTAPGARYHVALMDPLPAGAEPLNPELSGDRKLVPDSPAGDASPGAESKMGTMGILGWWCPQWFEHQNLRDHQAEAFTSLLYAGDYDYTYLMRATTPGDYHVPPTKVEEMYAPETFGRAGTEHVVVE